MIEAPFVRGCFKFAIMERVRIAQIVQRITTNFIETLEVFSDGSIEFAVYYPKASSIITS